MQFKKIFLILVAVLIATGFVMGFDAAVQASIYDDGGVHNIDQNIYPDRPIVAGTTTVNLLPGFDSWSPTFRDQAVVNLYTSSRSWDSIRFEGSPTLNLRNGGILAVPGIYFESGSPTVRLYDGSTWHLANMNGTGLVDILGGQHSALSLQESATGKQSGGQLANLFLSGNSRYRLDGGILDNVSLAAGSALEVFGGTIPYEFSFEGGVANVFGGVGVYPVFMGEGIVNLFGGELDGAYFGGTTGNIYGGMFGDLLAGDESIVNIYGNNLELTLIEDGIEYLRYALSGTLSDGTLLSNQDIYDYGGEINLYNVPEISSCIIWLVLGHLGTCCGVRRRQH